MRNIVFLYQQENELGEFFSLTMPMNLLISNGIHVTKATMDNISNIKDSIVYVVKHIHHSWSLLLKNNNNLIYLDMVDLLAHIGDNRNEYINYCLSTCYVDKIVVRQQFLEKNLAQFGSYIPHHYDFRLNTIEHIPANFKKTKISFPYTDSGGIFFHIQFPELFDVFSMDGKSFLNFDIVKDVHHKSMQNNFYFGLRRDDSLDYYFKPGTKTASAAAIGRNIIVNTDRALEDLLPNDYPYYFTKSSNEEFLDFYETKIKSPNSKEYEYGLECMKLVRQKTNINNQFDLYKNLFNI
jgi:hypothetical protein